VFQWHQRLLTRSRCEVRWLIGRRTKPTLFVFFCVFLVTCMTVMGKCFDACGDEEYYLRSSFSASEGAAVSVVSIAVECKSMGHMVGDHPSNEADFL
jgi:hypothetical protein